jgi:hypothetical protein
MSEKEILERIHHEIRELETDFKVEVLVSSLIQRGFTADQVLVSPQSVSKRSYRKEVSEFHTEVSDYDNKERLFLHTHRDGWYDALPENLFHQPTRGKTEKNKYETIEEIKRHREEEKTARRFFLPFEHEYQQVRNLLYAMENEYQVAGNKYQLTNNKYQGSELSDQLSDISDRGAIRDSKESGQASYSKVIGLFSGYWPILKKLDPYPAYVFFRIIPLLYRIRNDFALCAQSLGMILGVPIQIYQESFTNKKRAFADGFPIQPRLGEGFLGWNTVLGEYSIDGESDIKIDIGPLSSQEVPDFLTGGKQAEVLEELLDFFLGANYHTSIELLVEEVEKELVEGESVLGVSSFL